MNPENDVDRLVAELALFLDCIEADVLQWDGKLDTLVTGDVPDFGFDVGLGGREIDGEQAKVIFHDGAFDSVFVRGGKSPCSGESTGGDIVDRVAVRVLEFGDLGIVDVATDGDEVVGLGLLDQLDESLLFVGKVRPRFVTVSFDTELGASGEDSTVGRLLEGFFKPLPLLLSQQGGACIGVRYVIPVVE